jgi:nucleotide-binding universal stress UspA family protein
VAAWQRIGCAVDFSDGSHAALREASELARRFGAELVILHAEEMPGITDIPPPQGVVESTRRELEVMLARWKAEAALVLGRPVEGEMFPGPAAPALARAAADRRLDLLVTGTHGRRGFRHLVLGSVAERLVHLAPCAVLVVRST